jgi:hypothetical protein
MNRLCAVLFFVVLLMVVFTTNNCGSKRVLESVTITPAIANAKDYPNGQVLLTASGTFSRTPSRVDPLTVQWQLPVAPLACPAPLCVGPIGTTVEVTCAGIQSGMTAEVAAVAPRDPNIPAGTQTSAMITGKAQLICP